MKFRKKPVVIEAEQFTVTGRVPARVRGMTLWQDTNEARPRDMSWGYVVTIHGQKAHVQADDWILPEPDGVHFYPCKPDIFAATYEPVSNLEAENELVTREWLESIGWKTYIQWPSLELPNGELLEWRGAGLWINNIAICLAKNKTKIKALMVALGK